MHENTFSTFGNVLHAQNNVSHAKKTVHIFRFHEVAVLKRNFHHISLILV